MALSKGDFVSVTYTKFGHNVVNAICEVKSVTPMTGRVGLKLDVTKEQGNATPSLGEWLIYYPGEHCQIHYPEVVVGSQVKITGFMRSYKVGGYLPDQRGDVVLVTKTGTTPSGATKYKLANNYWYDRDQISVNLEATVDPGLGEPVPAPVKAVPRPDPKYKCINPKPPVSDERSLK